jgi:hypothetical protein
LARRPASQGNADEPGLRRATRPVSIPDPTGSRSGSRLPEVDAPGDVHCRSVGSPGWRTRLRSRVPAGRTLPFAYACMLAQQPGADAGSLACDGHLVTRIASASTPNRNTSDHAVQEARRYTRPARGPWRTAATPRRKHREASCNERR